MSARATNKAAPASAAQTACIATDGVRVEVERVGTHATVHGPRGARVYVRIGPSNGAPGLDAGPRTCLSFTLTGAHDVGLLLMRAALARSAA